MPIVLHFKLANGRNGKRELHKGIIERNGRNQNEDGEKRVHCEGASCSALLAIKV